MHNGNPGAKLQGGGGAFYISSSYVSLEGETVKFSYCHSKDTYGKVWKGNVKTLLEIFAQCYRLCIVQILLLPQQRLVHVSRKNARNLEKCNISSICRK